MFRRQPVVALLVLALVAACAAPAASPSATASGTPTASIASPTASPLPPPTAAPTPSPTPSPTLTPATPSPTIAPPTPTPAPTTMIVRAYFLMRDGSGGEVVNEPTLVPVLRTVPKSTATATAAMTALLAGPSAKERAPTWPIKTLIPAGSKLLGIEISGGLATVDLSAEFASLSPDDVWDGGSYSLHGRAGPGRLHPDPIPDGGSRQLQARRQAGQGVVRNAGPGKRCVRGNRHGQARHPRDVPRPLFVPRPLPAPDLRRSAGVGCRPAEPGPGHRTRQRLRGAVPDGPARSQRQGPGRCSGAGKLRHGLLGNGST